MVRDVAIEDFEPFQSITISIAKETSDYRIVTDDPENWRVVANRSFAQDETVASEGVAHHVNVRGVEFVDVILEPTGERKRVYTSISAVPSDAECSPTALEFPWCFANHSCEPNLLDRWGSDVPAELKNAYTTAMRPITEGEELTFDYLLESYHVPRFECLCGAAACRGSISGFNGLTGQQQSGLLSRASPFVQEKFRLESNFDPIGSLYRPHSKTRRTNHGHS
jgi:hypothetical protein